MNGFKINIDEKSKLVSLLQEIYDEACQQITSVQTEMNRLTQSVALKDLSTDEKAKYSKAMKEYMTIKQESNKQKIEIAKIMKEYQKDINDKDGNNMSKSSLKTEALSSILDKIKNSTNNKSEVQEYKMNKRDGKS